MKVSILVGSVFGWREALRRTAVALAQAGQAEDLKHGSQAGSKRGEQ